MAAPRTARQTGPLTRTKRRPLTKGGRHATLSHTVSRANRWRDQYNPLRGLTVSRAVQLIESYPLGEFADLQWTFGAPGMGIESADADLLALIERRTSPLLEMDWNVKTTDEQSPTSDDQVKFVEDLINGIDNLTEAIEHLSMATFRGFAHCELEENADGDIVRLLTVDQWNIVRDGSRGMWKYNPDARGGNFYSLPDEFLIDPRYFLIREIKRPLWRIALLKFIRENMCEKDWDGFIEIYGIPGGITILPPDVPPDKEDDYLETAEEISKGGHGALPNGADYKPNDQPRGINPFKERLDHLQAKLILAGTGGKLTMLNDATGIGSGASEQHQDTFDQIASAEAKKISELLQRQLIEPRLNARFPGQDHVAYFELAANEETDTNAYVQDVATLATAGYLVSPDEIREKTGYEVTYTPPAQAPQMAPGAPFFNRRAVPTLKTNKNESAAHARRMQRAQAGGLDATFLKKAARELGAAGEPVLRRIDQLLETPDAQFPAALKKLLSDIPQLLEDDDAVTAWETILTPALMEGLATSEITR
jgi:phage gp29-like protein